MNKIRFLLTTVAVLLCSVWTNAHDFEVDGIYYKVTSEGDLTVKVTYMGNSSSSAVYSGSITIPENVSYNDNEYTVTSIGDKAFYDCFSLTDINLPNSITSIGSGSFRDCSNLTSIIIPDKVVSIGASAFWECSGLVNVTIPSSVTSIGGAAFYGCRNFTEIVIPGSVTSIGYNVFSSCPNLASIVVDGENTMYDSRNYCNAIIETATNTLISGCKNTSIPNSVTSIGDYAFYYCSNLTSLEIPNSVESIGDNAFAYCSKLADVNIPSSLISIGSCSFDYCPWITNIELPNTLTSIGFAAFRECLGLTKIVIPNSVVSIGAEAFAKCKNITDFTIGSGVKNIGESAFMNCPNLTNIIMETPIPLSVSTMFGFNTSATLTVPNGSAKAYSDMGGFWGQFASIKEEASVNISEANKWSTCVLAFDAELPEGVRAFVSTGMDGNSVLMEEVTTLEAYKPYVLYAQDGYEGTLTGVVDLTAYQETVTDGVLSGAIVKQETSSGYILQNQGSGMKFYNVNGQTFTIPAGKCWLSVFDASGASVTMRFTGGVTGIEGVYVECPTDVMTDETMYDLEGRRVENPLPGRVYIKGGKKVMLKN